MAFDIGSLLAAVAGGTHGFQQGQAIEADQEQQQYARQQAMHLQRMAEDRAKTEQQNQQEQRFLQGFRPGQAPNSAAITQGIDTAGALAGSLGGGFTSPAIQAMKAAAPEQYAPDRFQQVNPSTYLDQTATPEAQQQRRQQSAAEIAMRAADAASRRTDARMQEHEDRADARMTSRIAATVPKPPKYQVVQTDQGTLQVNPETGESRPVMGPSGAPLQKPVPPQMQQAYLSNKTGIEKINRAIMNLSTHPKAIGVRRGFSDVANQYFDKDGTETRADVADIGSLLLHDRSGSAVTASESPRLKPFVPGTGDQASEAMKKLRRLREIAIEDNNALAGMYPGLAQPANPWRQ